MTETPQEYDPSNKEPTPDSADIGSEVYEIHSFKVHPGHIPVLYVDLRRRGDSSRASMPAEWHQRFVLTPDFLATLPSRTQFDACISDMKQIIWYLVEAQDPRTR